VNQEVCRVVKLEVNGKYMAIVNGYVVGTYNSIEKALYKMHKYAKSQGL